jgi:hypothetical protein
MSMSYYILRSNRSGLSSCKVTHMVGWVLAPEMACTDVAVDLGALHEF